VRRQFLDQDACEGAPCPDYNPERDSYSGAERGNAGALASERYSAYGCASEAKAGLGTPLVPCDSLNLSRQRTDNRLPRITWGRLSPLSDGIFHGLCREREAGDHS
jgi:hypothetical protein